MKVFSINEVAEPPPLITAQEVQQGQTFLHQGNVCLKEFAPKGRQRWVCLKSGDTWDNPDGVGACMLPVKLVNYAAVEQVVA